MHSCRAIGCTTSVDHVFVCCPPHWRMVPTLLQREVWRNARDDGKPPSNAWLIAVERAVVAIAVKEKKLTPAEAEARVEAALKVPWEAKRCMDTEPENDDMARKVNPAQVAMLFEATADFEQTAEEAEAELVADGVDVPAFLERVEVAVAEVRSVPPEPEPEPEVEPEIIEQPTEDEIIDEIVDVQFVEPFLRWAGSKRWASRQLADRVTQLLGPKGRYLEPFLGGGAVALRLPLGTHMILSDYCRPLAFLWWWILRDPEAVDVALSSFEEDWSNTAENYYRIREVYNAQPFSTKEPLPSARFLWLNRACFNGLYRENKDGGMNVPYGKRKRVSIPTIGELRAVRNQIMNATVLLGADFAHALAMGRRGDCAFVDPPYDGVFDDYNAGGFGPSAQERLAETLRKSVDRGMSFVMTNADTPRVRALYEGFEIETFEEPRRIAAKASSRVKTACVVVTGRGSSR